MEIINNVKLAPYTTFFIGGPARYFCVVKETSDLLSAFQFIRGHNLPFLILSGGSNMLISDEGFDGFVLKLEMPGIELNDGADAQTKLLTVNCGENWDKVVQFAIENNLWGIENLSHIPGLAGALAVQNVGAYGQEAKDTIESVEVLDTQTLTFKTFSNAECEFGYRKSIFNTTEKGHYVIIKITFKLTTNGEPNLSYRDLKAVFTSPPHEEGVGGGPSLQEIRDAVIAIRNKKFPFPVKPELGNAGSCFKNPILNKEQIEQLSDKIKQLGDPAVLDRFEKYSNNPDLQEGDTVKIPAAFLLEVCGLKGLMHGGAIINPAQPLVIVNHTGKASALDVLHIMKTVRSEVHGKLGVRLEIEPNLIGFTNTQIQEYMTIV